MFTYPVTITYDAETMRYQGICRDFPCVNCIGLTADEISSRLERMLIQCIAKLIQQRLPVPEGSVANETEMNIHLPLLVAMKTALHNSLVESGTRRAHLARRLGIHAPQMNRLLDLNHFSRIEMLEKALILSGKSVTLTVLSNENKKSLD
ncbi:hypothetical protein [Dryocola sp. LX212]|jgi:antitoxin HicB